ncbi:MAG: 3-methyl-2-oxobutanoate hydroxymethyltransferase [Gammaproteobacteria bacterium]|nr:3-methyl-2-oxobutanoate hydroxymethyltransferase [Gammaproteobacteria bacterium]
MSSQASPKGVVTVKTLRKFKANGEKFTSLTAYDAAFAAVLDNAGIDVVLVGDSVGMVVQGRDTTIPVTIDEIIYHSKMVARGLKRAMLMVDMPFMSYATEDQALHNASRLMKEGGAQIVKLEWGALQLGMVRRFTECGVPVCAHLGLTPQTYFKMGGYRVQGRDDDTAERMLNDAKALEEAGADVLLLECVPQGLAKLISNSVSTPVIGIGAGPDVDGQILVLYDILDIAPGKRTRFSKNYMESNSSIHGAVAQYDREVRSGEFPLAEHSFE